MVKTMFGTVRAKAFSMDYGTFGAGSRAFVILPGLSVKSVMLSMDAIAAAYADFAETHTVCVFDRIRSPEPGYSIRQMTEDTSEAMRLLGITEADVFGASQGGMIAMELALRHPERVRRLALSSTAARIDRSAKEILMRWVELAEAGDPVQLNRDMFRLIYSDEYREQYRDIFRAMEPDATPEELRKTAILASACEGFDCLDSLSQIHCPVLVTGSRADRVFTAAPSVEIAKRIPGSRIHLYEGYGHAVYDEAPDHRERLLRFFSK